MKILLLGEFSNVHTTLAKGLRLLGHEVTLASDGDGWKDYPRDVDLRRPSLGALSSAVYFCRLIKQFREFRGYDIVQLINPIFLPLKAERMGVFYKYLRRHNRRIVLGAFGMDHYYVKACLDCKTFRYSDFNFGNILRHSEENDIFVRDWLNGSKGLLHEQIAADCDAIVSGLYEYHAALEACGVTDKVRFIPFPIELPERATAREHAAGDPVRFFIGIQQSRSEYKGTDIMYRALKRVGERYPEGCSIDAVFSVPFGEYVERMNAGNVILDQLYSYTPAMNALEAMAKGLVVVGGGEPENYDILDEKELRPIVNVQPDEEDVYRQLCRLVERRDELLPRLSAESREYIRRHHEYVAVARRYEELYKEIL